MKQDNSKGSRKTILLIIGAVFLVIIFAVTTAIILRNIRSSLPGQTQNQDTAIQAKTEYDKAQESLTKGDLTAARTSFEKAQELYKQTNDTAHLKEIDAALSLITHTDPRTTSTKELPPASISTSD